MRFHRLTLSKLGLAHQCLFGFRADVPAVPRMPGTAARIGSATHALVEARVKKTTPPPIEQVYLETAQDILDGPLGAFVDSREWTVCETGYAYRPSRDLVHNWPRRGEPGYERTDDQLLAGTLDLAHVTSDEAYVIDVKTGKPPTDSEQLYGQAVMVARRFGVSKVRVAYGRALKTKFELLSEETLDADRLDAEAGRLGSLLRRLPVAQPNPGDHCFRCDAWQACPAKREEREQYVEPEPPPAALYSDDARLF